MNTTNPAGAPKPTEVWFSLNSLVRDHARESRDRISAVIDMPFSRFRALRRVAVRDLTQRELTDRLGIDAPATSGIVRDLVGLGLVEQHPHPTDARCKVVSITESGRRAVASVVDDPGIAPSMFAALDDTELRELARLLEKLRRAGEA